MRLRSPEKDSGSGDQSVVKTLHEFSYMFPPNMGVIVFCSSPDSMYPGNLAGTMVERGRLSARSADSSLPPKPSEKTRTRTSSGAEGGYLGAVWREVSHCCSRRDMFGKSGHTRQRSMREQQTASAITDARGVKLEQRLVHGGRPCEVGVAGVHLRFGPRWGRRLLRAVRRPLRHLRLAITHTPSCGAAPPYSKNELRHRRSGRARCVWVFW